MCSILKHPFDEIPAFQAAIKEAVDVVDPNYSKQFDGNFFVALEGK